METRRRKSLFHSSRGMVLILSFVVCAAVLFAGSTPLMAATSQKLFSSPEDALKGLAEAVKTKNKAALDPIFGPAYKELLSGDAVQDAAESEEFAKHMAEKAGFMKESDSRMVLLIGKENWPFPIPLIKKGGQWSFDTEAGREEILNRRIGEDELTAILVCRSYVKAQREYAVKDWDNDGVVAYAQKLRSEPGKKDGLFWKRVQGEPVSPLGELIAQARMEGYKKEKSVFKEEQTPFHGYNFKILMKQGENAPGGKYDYIINGNMVGGFALVAFPSNWGKSGIMTFIVNQRGTVYQKNLGKDTLKIVQNMDQYDPDATWTGVKE